jgi:hypothetical protein
MLAQRSWGQRGKMDMPPALAFAHGQLKANVCLRETAWWGWEDSNFQPNDYQPPALSIEQSGAVS